MAPDRAVVMRSWLCRSMWSPPHAACRLTSGGLQITAHSVPSARVCHGARSLGRRLLLHRASRAAAARQTSMTAQVCATDWARMVRWR